MTWEKSGETWELIGSASTHNWLGVGGRRSDGIERFIGKTLCKKLFWFIFERSSSPIDMVNYAQTSGTLNADPTPPVLAETQMQAQCEQRDTQKPL